MISHGERGHVPVGLVVVVVALVIALVVLWLYCRKSGTYGAAKAPPPPPFATRVDSTTRDSVLAYARSLEYDPTPGAGDEQRLMVGSKCPPWAPGGNCTYGPRVQIQPQSGSYAIADTFQLASGRFVARLVTLDSAYKKLNLRTGPVTYWWVDEHGPGSTWRSVFVSADTMDTLVIRNNRSTFHPGSPTPGYRWWQAIARFEWRETDEGLWVTCTKSGCCRSDM